MNSLNLSTEREGNVEIIKIYISISVEDKSFLHIGAAPSPLTEKKGAVFKVEGTPVIPATSFKGALRNQMELLFIERLNDFKGRFEPENEDYLKPCIPSPDPSEAEIKLLSEGYRGTMEKKKYKKYNGHCAIEVDDKDKDKGVILPKLGICPVCYFMGATGIMGFLRFTNLYPEGYPKGGDWLIDQTNIRIDRRTKTAAHGAKVDGEQVKPGTKFTGTIEVISKTPQGFEFGQPREIGDQKIDKWLERWRENDREKRKRILIEEILCPAIENIKLLGGQKSRGAGKVKVEITNNK